MFSITKTDIWQRHVCAEHVKPGGVNDGDASIIYHLLYVLERNMIAHLAVQNCTGPYTENIENFYFASNIVHVQTQTLGTESACVEIAANISRPET